MNETIKQFLNDGKITQEEYDALFDDKSNWLIREYSYSEIWDSDDITLKKQQEELQKHNLYTTALDKVIKLQYNSEKIDLSQSTGTVVT